MKRFTALAVALTLISSMTGCLCWPNGQFVGAPLMGGMGGGCPGGNCGVGGPGYGGPGYGGAQIQGSTGYPTQAGIAGPGAPVAFAPIQTNQIASGNGTYYVPQTAFAPLETLPTF